MKLIKIFFITFGLTFAAMFVLDLPPVKKYIKKEIIQAKILGTKWRYLSTPQGIDS